MYKHFSYANLSSINILFLKRALKKVNILFYTIDISQYMKVDFKAKRKSPAPDLIISLKLTSSKIH